LQQAQDGSYRVAINGTECLRTRSRKTAVKRFNEMRSELEQAYPARQLTEAEKEKTMHTAIGDSLVAHNSLGGRKKKTSAGGTRTFGG
jgi:hypothetical protein